MAGEVEIESQPLREREHRGKASNSQDEFPPARPSTFDDLANGNDDCGQHEFINRHPQHVPVLECPIGHGVRLVELRAGLKQNVRHQQIGHADRKKDNGQKLIPARLGEVDAHETSAREFVSEALYSISPTVGHPFL